LTGTQTFNEKVNLIYEYNKLSPLFVRVANNELGKNNFERAVEILNEGLVHYPYYPVAHIMLGKSLMLLGEYKKALDSFRKGSELINSRKVYDYYLLEVEKLKKQRIFVEDADNKIGGSEEPKKINLQDELTSFDSMNNQDSGSSYLKSGSESIVSETLANIYATQGESAEAIKIFEKLIIKNPHKKEYYLQKINEIKKQT